jgi:uncharacterized protein (TIGR03083 family)
MTLPPPAAFRTAAATFVELVERIPAGAWDGPGLAVWDLRALVGHTSRSLVTVLEYLDRPAAAEDVDSAATYYLRAAEFARGAGAAAVAERGRVAGAALGDDPAAAVRDLADRAVAKAAAADPDALVTTIVGGMRVAPYLATRTFELVVHGFDIAAATGLEVAFPPEVVAEAAELAVRAAVALGRGPAVLRALTGRGALPDGFSVV